MSSCIRTTACVVLALVASASALLAQTSDSSSAMPVDVRASAAVVGPSRPVRLYGSTPAIAGARSVTLTITPPAGAPAMLTAPVDPSGGYAAIFTGTRASGEYHVRAMAPDGKGVATATFQVFDGAAVASDVAGGSRELVTAIASAVGKASALVTALPASPARLELLDSIANLERALDRLTPALAQIPPFIERARAVTARYPDAAPQFEPMLTRLETWTAQSRAEAVRINAELLSSSAAGVTCESLDRVTDAFRLVSAALAFFQRGSPSSIIKAIGGSFATDMALDRWAAELTPPSRRGDRAYGFMVTEAIKLGPSISGGVGGVATALVTMAADFSAFTSQGYFARYCEKFEGPLQATMHAEFTRNGLKWWIYDVAIEGRLVLRYARGSTGAAARVRGELIGSGTSFRMRENAAEVLFPDEMRGKAVVLRRLVTPVGTPFSTVEGNLTASLGPNSFRIPVEGDLVGTRLTLRLSPATHDFDGAVARGMYAIAGPRTLGIPLFTNFTLPFKGARWILTRTLVDESGSGSFTVLVDRGTGGMTIERSADAERPGADNSAHYSLKLKACNPGC